MRGFEPPTPRSTVWCSNQLSYILRSNQILIDVRRISKGPTTRKPALDVRVLSRIMTVPISVARTWICAEVAPMSLGLLGLKVGMTQVYDEKGVIAPVTVLQLGPCPVLQVRDQERDGYDAVQLGFQDKARRKASRAERGHVSDQLESKRRKA